MADHTDLARQWADHVRQATLDRNTHIRALRAEGLSYRAIGEIVGLSHTQIKNITTVARGDE